MYEVLGNGIFVLLGAAISAISTYLAQKTVAQNEAKRVRVEALSAEKSDVIADLIAYRFVITGVPIYDSTAITKFNAALSGVPVYFSENKKCLDLYRSLGENFNAEKFYTLVVALMEDVPLDISKIDKHLLESVPAARYQLAPSNHVRISLDGMSTDQQNSV